MGDSPLPSPNPSHSPPLCLPPPPPEPASGVRRRFLGIHRPAVRVTSEFDSESSLLFHKVSCKLIDGLAKLKLSFQSGGGGGSFASPQLGFLAKNFSVLYDLDSRNALLEGFVNIADFLQLRATHDVKDQQGQIALTANLGDPSYKLELSSLVPSVGLPRATLQFPLGEVSVEEKKTEESGSVLSVNGIVKSHLFNGLCTALYRDDDLNLRYCFKDDELSFIPSVSLPSNAVSLAFKRRFSPSDKLSYWYNFDSNDWSAVYKHTIDKSLKIKAGYGSAVRIGWASLWVGDEGGRTKTAPMKMKVQFMVQVPQDDITKPVFMFRVKKRWDF